MLFRSQRFLPCLLDRLRDDTPNDQAVTRAQRAISMSRYKEAVVRDLEWLFNASAHLPIEGKRQIRLDDYPEAQRSVINFGLRQLCGILAPDMDALQKEITEALQNFEPRILKHKIRVRASLDRHLISLEIQADLWADPLPQQFLIKTTIDLENGQCVLGASANG